MSITLTESEFKESLPKALQGKVNKEVIKQINDVLTDPDTAEMMRDNIIGFSSVLQEGKFKISSYLDAVKYVSFRMMGNSTKIAYVKTFPDRYNDFKARGLSDKVISSHVSAYNKNKLVTLVYTQSLVPTSILNADVLQEAINTQREIMLDKDVSPKVRSDAANSLMVNLKRPEESAIEMSIDVKDTGALHDLKELSRNLAQTFVNNINNGSQSSKEVAEYKIIQGEYEEVPNE